LGLDSFSRGSYPFLKPPGAEIITKYVKVSKGKMLAKRPSEPWCKVMHESPMWPIHGHYQCRACRRIYRVPWTQIHESPKHASPQAFKQVLEGR